MTRKLAIYLRQGLPCIVLLGALGFGTAQAFASPSRVPTPEPTSCMPTGFAYVPLYCYECGPAFGYCDGYDLACFCDY